MDSEDDMHDADDLESFEDDFYSDGSALESNDEADDDDADGEYDFADGDFDDDYRPGSSRQENYTVLSEDDIRQQQEDDIIKLSNILSISSAESCILLHHYNWNVSRLHEEWFADEDNVRKTVGLLPTLVQMRDASELSCGICFDTYPRHVMRAATCGHQFCEECWRGYIGTSINDGQGCLMLRCPDPSCAAAIGQDMVNDLVSSEDKEKYSRYLLRSYVEDSKKKKWCPAAGCEFAVEFVMGSANYDVYCRCAYGFCWNCTVEAHRPVDCETVAKWILKNSAESENMNWILANSKPCPKCKRPIEKNHGCMHMTCSLPCKFEFCWLCLGAWSEHGERTGGFYACNRYETAKQEGVYGEAEKRREMAKNSLERYSHYYERWASNQVSRQKAIADLESMRTEKLDKLSEKQSQPESQLKFVIEAWEQIVECRRVLKWTYAYGYYLPEDEHAKKVFFEYLQGEAEAGLERLHQCAEKELQVYLDADDTLQEFNGFRTKLAGLTSLSSYICEERENFAASALRTASHPQCRGTVGCEIQCVTRTYFENLVRALETGLQDVEQIPRSQGAKVSSKAGKSKGAGTSRR